MARFFWCEESKMKSMKKLKAELLANPAVRQAYDAQAPEFELARELIARIESGRATPSMRTVQRFANAVGARAVVRMEPLTAGRNS
jgi:predicted transcriptional regulator